MFRKIIDDAVQKGKFIELHEKRKVDDGKNFNMPVLVCVADIVSIEMSDDMVTGCYLSLRGRKRALHITENYQDVRRMVREAFDKDKDVLCKEKQIKPYRVDRSCKFYGVQTIVMERATQKHYGLLCSMVNDTSHYFLSVEMEESGDGYLYPKVGKMVWKIPCDLVEN